MQTDENENAVTPSTGKATASKARRTASPPPAKEATKKQAYMYLGPNIPGGILFNGAILKNELPAHLNDVFAKIPALKALCVEVKEAATFKQELERQGSEPNRLVQNVKRLIKEGALANG
jgi:hypothetical protein